MGNDYWQTQTEPLNRSFGNIAAALTRRPLIQSQAALLQARMAEQQQMAQETAARTRLIQQQTGKLATGDSRLDDYGDKTQSYAAAQAAYAANPNAQTKSALDSATSDFLGAGAKVNNMKVGDIVKALGNSGALQNLVSGSPNFAQAGGMQGQAASVANNQADNTQRANRPMNVTGALMSPTGNILGVAPKNVPQGDTVVGQAGTPPMTPIAQGAPAPARTTASDTAKAQLVKEIIAKQGDTGNGGTNTVQSATGQFDAAMAPIAATPAAGSAVVRVQHPDGTTGTIPAANLPAALKLGYKQIQ